MRQLCPYIFVYIVPGKFSTEKEDSITYNKMNGYLYVITITERVHKYVSRVKCVQI